MPQNAKRRFVGLDVEEVSLVDSPANQVEFLVTKSTEDEEMSENGGASETERVMTETLVADDAAVTKALEQVSKIVDKIEQIAKGSQQPVPETPSAETSEENVAEVTTDEAEVDVEKSVETLLKTLGFEGDAFEAAKKKLEKAGFKNPGFKGMKAPLAKTQKAESIEDTDGAVPLTLESFVDAVSKAKAFTPARVEKLLKLQEIVKELIESIGVGQSPNTNVPTVQTHPNNSQVRPTGTSEPLRVAKSELEGLTEAITKSLEPLVETVKSLSGRVEAIEKARPAGNALPENETDTNVKKNANFWSGIL